MTKTKKNLTYDKALTEFLELCAFEREEIKDQWPRIKKTFETWEISEPEQFVAASARLKRYYDMSLKGLRMAFGVYIRELCNLTLCGEEKDKRIYIVMPSPLAGLLNGFSLKYPNVYTGLPDMICFMTLGTLFDKTQKYMDESEKRYFYPGQAHCSCNMLRTSALFEGKYAKPDLILTTSHYCDEAWKTDEMLTEYLGIPMVVVDRTQDYQWEDGMQMDWRRLRFYVEEIKHAKAEIEEITGLEIGKDDLVTSLMDMRDFTGHLNRIVELIIKTDPAPITYKDIIPFLWLLRCGCMPDNRLRRLEALQTLLSEVQDRVARQEGPLPKGSPRYITAGFASIIDPEMLSFLEEQGLCVCCAESCFWMPNATIDAPMLGAEGFEPSPEFAAGGIGVFEAMTFAFVLTAIPNSLNGRLQMIEKVIDEFKDGPYGLDGYLLPGHYPCRIYGTDMLMVKHTVDKTGIPNMALELDLFDRRFYSPAAIRTKLEAFAETVKLHKAMNA